MPWPVGEGFSRRQRSEQYFCGVEGGLRGLGLRGAGVGEGG